MENIIETKNCKNCSAEFTITDWDKDMYEKVKAPFPTWCPDCRALRKQSHVNQINLFKRKCDGTGETIVSNFPPDSPHKIYKQEYWYSDKHDPTDYGRDFDFSRPFFEQFQELLNDVPYPALFTDYMNDDNSEFTNSAGRNKNCYMIFDSDENWDCLNSFGLNNSKNTMESFRGQNHELCYEAIDSKNCYNSYYIHNCENCIDSMFLNNCIGCKNCIYCSNLNQKEYHVFNEKVSKERYEEIKQGFGSHEFLADKIEKFEEFRLKYPQKYMHGFKNENCTGDYLINCKDAQHCYDSMSIWDGKYCNQIFIKAKDCIDCDECGEAELVCESVIAGYGSYDIRFSLCCLHQNTSLTYCNHCFHCKNLFGCAGLNRKEYHIFNKKYSPEEYEQLAAKITEHMKSTGEWGEFFPTSLSPFGYNLSKAQENFPLTKEEATAKGYKWQDEDKKEFQPATNTMLDNISDAPDETPSHLYACEDCGKNYKIIERELAIYRKMNLALPRLCFSCRHKKRKTGRNPRQLHDRTCQKCSVEIKTTYSPDRPEIVYCEKCYQESLT